MTREEIELALLREESVHIGSGGADTITLATPRARRLASTLFTYLRSNSVELLREDQTFFEALEATDTATNDPAANVAPEASDGGDGAARCWRLLQVRTKGFGGLNTIGGNDFVHDVAGASWLIEGQNGTGKSSLANAILFAMTGMIFRDQLGLVADPTKAQPVFDQDGRQIAKWPPIACYPNDWSGEVPDIDLSVELIFQDVDTGEEAVARRTIKGRVGDLQIEADVDPRLNGVPALIDAGLVMPMRLHHIRIPVEADNTVLVQLVRQLTGLDPLLDVAALAAALCNGNQRFLRYARDNKSSIAHTNFLNHLGKATVALEGIADPPEIETDFTDGQLVDQSRLDAFKETKNQLERRQAEAFATLSELAFDGFDPEQAEHRERVRTAIVELSVDAERARRREGAPHILVDLSTLMARRGAHQMEALNAAILEAQQRLNKARRWHEEQERDQRLKLKAAAAAHFDDTGDPICPVCGQSLAAGKHKPLVEMLKTLKRDAEAAQTGLDDACRKIRDDLIRTAVPVIPEELRDPKRYSVKESVGGDVSHRFIDAQRVMNDLPGFKPAAEAAIGDAFDSVEDFQFGTELEVPADGDLKGEVNRLIDHMGALVEAAGRWPNAVEMYREAWSALMNADDAKSLAGKIAEAKAAVDAAQPYLDAAKDLREAINIAGAYNAIVKRQLLRKALAEDLRPLTKLRDLVNQEADKTIASLSKKAEKIHGLIYNPEALTYRGIEVQSGRAGKQSLAVHAQPSVPPQSDDDIPAWKVDASELANTSWMRGILWSFVFAIRAHTIEKAGCCPFPLMVLDEPQLTYDSRNRRGWVKFLSEATGNVAPEAPLQLLALTHDTEFANYFVAHESISSAAIERGIAPGGDSQILSGNFAEVRFERMKETGSDEMARGYISDVRVLAETMLKFSLEDVRPGIVLDQSQTLGTVTLKIVKPSIDRREPPFTNPVFKKYLDIYEKNPALTRLINEPHHSPSSQITVREAKQVHEFWCAELFGALKAIWFEYRLHRKLIFGEVAAIPLPANLNHKPKHSNAAASFSPRLIGRVSAYTDGRVSLGAMSWSLYESDGEAMALRGLAAYRLEADTLAPTARPGDTLLVRLGGSHRPPNLVIEDRGSSLAARRLIQDPDVPNLMVLSASPSNPRHTPRAIITREFGAKRWKIVGTLFTSVDMKAGDHFATDTEATPCAADDRAVMALLSDTSLVEVEGESAEPIALSKQYLLVKPERIDLIEACRDLDGRPIVALDQADQAFFKRLRNVGAGEVALESMDATGVGKLVMMSLSNGTNGTGTLRSIRPVVGVIFEWLDGSR